MEKSGWSSRVVGGEEEGEGSGAITSEAEEEVGKLGLGGCGRREEG